MRAFTELWDRICRERYGVEDPKLRRFRYGVQVNSLGLTEQQPENNVQRIVLETLGVTLSKSARARAMQLPAWNEALGLPRPWDQQWSLRMQQVLAFESDLLEYDDIFEGSVVIAGQDGRTGRGGHRPSWPTWRRSVAPSRPSTSSSGGSCAARPSGCGASSRASRRSSASTASPRRHRRPLLGDGEFDNILKVDHRVEAEQIAEVEALAGRARRRRRCARALDELRRVADDDGPGRQRHGGDHRAGPRRRHHRGVGRRAPRGLRRVPGAHRRQRRRRPPGRRAGAAFGSGPGPWPSAPAARRGSWSPSRASTATPTAPSRSPWRPATPGSR